MAKPIRATPSLLGADAIRFLENMKQKEQSKVTKKDRDMFRAIEKIKFKFW